MSVFKEAIKAVIDNLAEGETITAELIDSEIDKAFPLHAVPKETYLQEKKANQDNKATIATLQGQVEEGSKAADTIAALQQQIADKEAADAKAAKQAAFDKAVTEAGGVKPSYIKFALSEAGVDLETVDPELLAYKIAELKGKEEFADAFKKDEDDAANNNGSSSQQQAGFKVIDNGIKKNGTTEEDAITAQLAAAMGVKQ